MLICERALHVGYKHPFRTGPNSQGTVAEHIAEVGQKQFLSALLSLPNCALVAPGNAPLSWRRLPELPTTTVAAMNQHSRGHSILRSIVETARKQGWDILETLQKPPDELIRMIEAA